MGNRKIALFATGWGAEITEQYLSGLIKGFENTNTDIYLFLCYALVSDATDVMNGELNIFSLPDLHDFDGAALLGNGMDFPGLFDDLRARCLDAGIPSVCTGRKGDGLYFVGSDNYAGSKELVDHLIENHNCKDIFFIAGSFDNEDSNARMKAYLDSMEAHGMPVGDEHILLGHWTPDIAVEQAFKVLDEGRKVDAFVCSNDSMAMAVCANLIDRGYDVPGDIKVTGFDNSYFARIFDPSISSVDQRLFKVGEESANMITDLINGAKHEYESFIPCTFVPSESCGCPAGDDIQSIRKKIGREAFLSDMHVTTFDAKLNRVERDALKCNSYEDFCECIRESFISSHSYEGPTFYIVVEPSFAHSMHNPNANYIAKGYNKRSDVILASVDEKMHTYRSFETRKLIPILPDDGKNHLFMFLPLHENERNFGYMVMCDDPKKVANYNTLFAYTSRMGMLFDKFRRNMVTSYLYDKLKEINETDAMTRVKNRNAFTTKEFNIDKSIKDNSPVPFAVAMFDINNLKTINDLLGHEAGDKYIIDCCQLICKTFKKSPVYRIGGDEFVVVLTGDDYSNSAVLLDEFNKCTMKFVNSDLPINNRLSIASGVSSFDPDKDCCFNDVKNRADEAMYKNKVQMKGGKEHVR